MKHIIILHLFASFLLSSCNSSSNSNNNSTDSTTNPVIVPPVSSNCANGDVNAAGVADFGQTIDYYKLNNPPIIARGGANAGIVWSSDTDLPADYNQSIFYSDSRLNVRVIPRYQNKGFDSRGIACEKYPAPFKKMNIGVVIRTRNSSPGVGNYYQFQDVDVNCPSKTREFSIPTTSDPLIIEVMNVEWDHSCNDYANQGFPNQPGFCPYSFVWEHECYQLEVQFSTDTTKDLPGPRAY